MHTRIKAEIIALARLTPTVEICGFIGVNQSGPFVFPCRNVAPNPAEEFAIDSQDHIRALSAGELLGIYHSHPSAASFSPEDLEYADEMALPQYLYSIPDNKWHEYLPPTFQPPLEGLHFTIGFRDCYSLVRDYYRQHFSCYLSDYDRDESFSHEDQGIIMDSFDREGFKIVRLDVIQVHDILLFKSNKVLPQHFGVYLGKNLFLHHPRGSLSGSELLNDRWLSRLICAFRLKTLPVLV